MLQLKYPFDPSIKHHIFIAFGLALWIFIFLYFTEPLDVNELSDLEKLYYLPFYGIAGGIAYILMLPFQYWLFKISKTQWTLSNELVFFLFFITMGLILSRSVYVNLVVPNEPNMYSLSYFIKAIYIPVVTALFPIIIIGRWAIGKYKTKKLDDKKIIIKGEGTYEGLRLLQENLICIKADDNYIEVTYLINGVLKNQLIRNKLSVIEHDLSFLLRTHRSFLINPIHFHQWEMNAGKLHLILTTDLKIPVSKTYASKVKLAMESLNSKN